ncbi:multicopper oxidase domain-containing protein [Bacillus sp. BRMEA1]|uniref:multicopper oxidase domain-containing protein n=1 Tax=Neobacillus endophyticus TaxID=2738405 RepID=UPI0015643DDB|nr:multicopper oxidase domain-containing protein [Neobacillus endophyticus]NRD76731.1 multicopper oxidase domain-containing protein [Neobacillus endophyticus]
MGKNIKTTAMIAVSLIILTACGSSNLTSHKSAQAKKISNSNTPVSDPRAHLNQTPTPMKVNRIGLHEVKVEMTAQITDIEIAKDDFYKAWTFNGQAPGPVIVVDQGDKIDFTLKNMDPTYPHSMDMHAVHSAPSKNFINVMPNQSGSFSYTADNQGVFMYHCGTKPVLEHIANGMHGMIIAKPKGGYPTDSQVNREYIVIQNEWYKYDSMDDMTNGKPKYVVFSTKALSSRQMNTNGTVGALVNHPLLAKVGDRVRFYVLNVGPNEVSSFHIVGTLFDDVYLDGNPYNHLKGMQTVMLPASGGAVVEFTLTQEGSYPFVTHQFNDATKGANGVIKVTKNGKDDGSVIMAH